MKILSLGSRAAKTTGKSVGLRKFETKRHLFDPNSKKPFKLSRSKIELFIDSHRLYAVVL
ncbi:hypothetical protein COS81_00745 [candidate division WWE3 bacterium CG06_land_8_20_14_3_00_42_16]|uniref:Uncharacterized protein n=2 Tax=Katanobacteria TaxID=422282 RepID=A0A2M7APF1_UNCKA|nr:MAG: hypothetical protein COS81_00745 [candidate division WWE3 bacterium CG06_land_8_20_14_3_00_42_16]PJA37110.1 MAG: hypothetical protein CO181_04940 [candidate division WWE3 bacterium CG_4_9_14_3_um_filter_43_9]